MSYGDVIKATPGLAGYWPIEGTPEDAGPNGLDAVNFGVGPLSLVGPGLLAPANDPDGLSAEFGGNGAGALQVAHNAVLLPGSPGWAAEAWGVLRGWNPTASEYHALMGKSSTMIMRLGPSAPSVPTFQTYYYNSALASLGISPVAGAPWFPPLLDTLYYIVDRVIDNGDATFTSQQWINGDLNREVVFAGVNASWSAAANVLLLGSWSSNVRTWDGWGQHFAWYDAPLEPARIKQRWRCGMGLERAPSWQADRRFSSNGSAPAGADGTIGYGMFGGSFDLGDALANDVVTRDPMLMDRLRATGYFTEAAA